MKWIVIAALALAPLAGCASTPGYGAWIVNDYCGNLWDDQPTWRRTEAPPNADAYRQAANEAADDNDRATDPEYWFAAPSGEVKLCRTNLQRAAGRRDWCRPRLAEWWVFRDSEAGPVIHMHQSPICLT